MLKKTKTKIITAIWIIGSIASIIWLILFFLPNDSNDKPITRLYPNIIFDYYGAWTWKIKEAFWIPYNEYKNFEWIDKYLYKLENWTIEFWWWVRIELYDETNILLPDFYNRGEGYKNIIFWNSTFKDICENYSVNRITSSWWTLNDAKYTEVEYYTWNFWQYKTYIFWTHYTTWDSFNIWESYIYTEDNSDILEKCSKYYDIKFDYIIIM